jgi:hypothetical protein
METQSNNPVEDKKAVAGLVKKSNRILAMVRSHRFPIDLFPDTLQVEDTMVTVVTRRFFFTSEVYSVDIKNIANIMVNTAPLFAEMVIVSNAFAQNIIKIRYLWKEQAMEMRQIIEGLRAFSKEGVDTLAFSKEELMNKLRQFNQQEIIT